jgi:hypothetical protein
MARAGHEDRRRKNHWHLGKASFWGSRTRQEFGFLRSGDFSYPLAGAYKNGVRGRNTSFAVRGNYSDFSCLVLGVPSLYRRKILDWPEGIASGAGSYRANGEAERNTKP